MEGSWSLTVRTPSGDVGIQATLHLENGAVTGHFSGDRGSGDISGGTLEGSTLEFTIAARTEGETGDWVFHGTVSGSSVSGTVSTTLGTFQFSGSKPK